MNQLMRPLFLRKILNRHPASHLGHSDIAQLLMIAAQVALWQIRRYG